MQSIHHPKPVWSIHSWAVQMGYVTLLQFLRCCATLVCWHTNRHGCSIHGEHRVCLAFHLDAMLQQALSKAISSHFSNFCSTFIFYRGQWFLILPLMSHTASQGFYLRPLLIDYSCRNAKLSFFSRSGTSKHLASQWILHSHLFFMSSHLGLHQFPEMSSLGQSMGSIPSFPFTQYVSCPVVTKVFEMCFLKSPAYTCLPSAHNAYLAWSPSRWLQDFYILSLGL